MASSPNSVRSRFETLRVIAFGTITTGYLPIGSPLANPARIIKISNDTNVNVRISTDGVNDHDIVVDNGFTLYDYTSNKSNTGGLLEQPQGTQFYVKAESTLPSSGNVYLTVIYASPV